MEDSAPTQIVSPNIHSMHSKENSPLSQKPQFGGSVELIPPAPIMIRFASKGRSWTFPIHALCSFILESNPDNPERKKSLPPDQLTLTYYSATVILRGWRLDSLADSLACGRVARIHAVDGPMAHLVIDEPWVTELRVHRIEELSSTLPQPADPSEN